MSDPHVEPVDRLAGWYDDQTLARIDAALADYRQLGPAPQSATPPARGRAATAGLALTVAALAGVKDATDPEPEEVFEEIDPDFIGSDDQFVTLYFVPGDPKASRAIVRPWLAPSIVAANPTHVSDDWAG